MKKYVQVKNFVELYYYLQKILKFDQYLISGKTACIIYAYLESLVKTIDKCKNYPERSSATKIGEDIPC